MHLPNLLMHLPSHLTRPPDLLTHPPNLLTQVRVTHLSRLLDLPHIQDTHQSLPQLPHNPPIMFRLLKRFMSLLINQGISRLLILYPVLLEPLIWSPRNQIMKHKPVLILPKEIIVFMPKLHFLTPDSIEKKRLRGRNRIFFLVPFLQVHKKLCQLLAAALQHPKPVLARLSRLKISCDNKY